LAPPLVCFGSRAKKRSRDGSIKRVYLVVQLFLFRQNSQPVTVFPTPPQNTTPRALGLFKCIKLRRTGCPLRLLSPVHSADTPCRTQTPSTTTMSTTHNNRRPRHHQSHLPRPQARHRFPGRIARQPRRRPLRLSPTSRGGSSSAGWAFLERCVRLRYASGEALLTR
jgi:hypothetical protein